MEQGRIPTNDGRYRWARGVGSALSAAIIGIWAAACDEESTDRDAAALDAGSNRDAANPSDAGPGVDAPPVDAPRADSPLADAGGDPGIVFRADWSSSLGADEAAIGDDGRWNELFTCGRADVLSVVSGADLDWSRTPNVLRVQEIGNYACGAVQRRDVVGPSTTHYGRLYLRNDETTQNLSFHNFSYNFVGDIQWVFLNRRSLDETTFEIDVRLPAEYPHNIWRMQTDPGTDPFDPPLIALTNGRWYRYEWQVEYVTPTTMRFWPRMYGPDGALLADASQFFQVDAPNSGVDSLASWYAAGNAFTVRDLALARHFGVGNEGRAPDPRPGEAWYVADVAVATGGWIGER